MGTFKEHEVAINLKLLKQCGYYHIMFNSNHARIVGRNVYRFFFIVFVAITQCLIFFGNLGFFIRIDDTLRFVDYFLIMYGNVHNWFLLFKLCLLMSNSKKIWEVFEVAHLKFFKSAQCRKNVSVLNKHRDKVIKMTNIYCIFCIMVIIQWIIFPLVIKIFTSNNRGDQRIQNIINMPYPVNIHTFNQYFIIFYIFETCMSVYLMYGLVMIDMFLLSFGWVIIAQYKVLTLTFKRIGHEVAPLSDNDFINDTYDEFKSVLHDLLQLDEKVKLYNSIVKPIVLIYVAVTSFLFIILTFALILILMSSETVPVLSIFKISSGILYHCFQLLLYCNLFDNLKTKVNIVLIISGLCIIKIIFEQKESVNFGMYSCNWTMMDINFKKLLLLVMQMNDANQSMVKFSPKIIIDLKLFSNVLMTSYNILSIMVKTISNKNLQNQ